MTSETLDATIIDIPGRSLDGFVVLKVRTGSGQLEEVVMSPRQFRDTVLASETERAAFDEWWGSIEES